MCSGATTVLSAESESGGKPPRVLSCDPQLLCVAGVLPSMSRTTGSVTLPGSRANNRRSLGCIFVTYVSPTPLTPKHKRPKGGMWTTVRVFKRFLQDRVRLEDSGGVSDSGGGESWVGHRLWPVCRMSAPKARMWVTTQQGLCPGGFLTCVSEPEGEILPCSTDRTCFLLNNKATRRGS